MVRSPPQQSPQHHTRIWSKAGERRRTLHHRKKLAFYSFSNYREHWRQGAKWTLPPPVLDLFIAALELPRQLPHDWHNELAALKTESALLRAENITLRNSSDGKRELEQRLSIAEQQLAAAKKTVSSWRAVSMIEQLEIL